VVVEGVAASGMDKCNILCRGMDMGMGMSMGMGMLRLASGLILGIASGTVVSRRQE
jgi:hypothetical protein